MTQLDLRKHQTDMRYKLAFYAIGLTVAFILALTGSQYAGEAFALIGGIVGGSGLLGETKQ